MKYVVKLPVVDAVQTDCLRFIRVHGQELRAEIGDWVITWPDKVMQVMKDDEFRRTFDKFPEAMPDDHWPAPLAVGAEVILTNGEHVIVAAYPTPSRGMAAVMDEGHGIVYDHAANGYRRMNTGDWH